MCRVQQSVCVCVQLGQGMAVGQKQLHLSLLFNSITFHCHTTAISTDTVLDLLHYFCERTGQVRVVCILFFPHSTNSHALLRGRIDLLLLLKQAEVLLQLPFELTRQL